MTREEALVELDRVRDDPEYALREYVRIKLADGETRRVTDAEVLACVELMRKGLMNKTTKEK